MVGDPWYINLRFVRPIIWVVWRGRTQNDIRDSDVGSTKLSKKTTRLRDRQ